MTTLLIAFTVLSLVVVPLAPRLGTRVFAVAALAPAAAFVWTLAQGPAVLGGRAVEEHLEYLPPSASISTCGSTPWPGPSPWSSPASARS